MPGTPYTHQILPGVTRRFVPLYDYILVRDPLTPAQRETIGWGERRPRSPRSTSPLPGGTDLLDGRGDHTRAAPREPRKTAERRAAAVDRAGIGFSS
jgi:hypothetical protein